MSHSMQLRSWFLIDFSFENVRSPVLSIGIMDKLSRVAMSIFWNVDSNVVEFNRLIPFHRCWSCFSFVVFKLLALFNYVTTNSSLCPCDDEMPANHIWLLFFWRSCMFFSNVRKPKRLSMCSQPFSRSDNPLINMRVMNLWRSGIRFNFKLFTSSQKNVN